MQTTFALAALAAVAHAIPQTTDNSGAVVAAVSPSGAPPAGAQTTYPGNFQLTVVNITASANQKRQSTTCGQAGTLTVSLRNGVLTDAQSRTGYIANNYQFQFDAPPQAGAIYTAGFSVTSNSSLALGSSAIFYSCLSGSFSNLYDRAWAPQCLPVYLSVLSCAGSSSAVASASPTARVSQISDGQPQATSAATRVTTATARVSQISDGQVQATTRAPAPVISQISDGQIQMPTNRPVVSQISDGQIQVTSARATTTSRPAVVSQISDGQIQATTRPATTSAARNATATPVPFTGAASSVAVLGSLGAVVVGAVMMVWL